MRRLNLIIAVSTLVFSLNASGQIKSNCSGDIGIGGSAKTTDRLSIYDHNATINFVNGNNHEYILGNYHTSLWSAPNTFSLYDKTSGRYLMEFRQDATYIHNQFRFGGGGDGGIIAGSNLGFYAGANGYNFNSANSDGGAIFENSYGGESSGFYCDEDFAVIWSPGDGGSGAAGGYGYLLKVLDEDYMNGSSALKWYVDGDGDTYKNSDLRKKENIKTISNTLEKINKINGVSYDFKSNEKEKLKRDSLLNSNKIEKQKLQKTGFIAQDIEKVFPEIVQTDENGYKYVNYEGLIPVLVEGIKELQSQVEYLENEIIVMQSDCCDKNTKSSLKSAQVSPTNTDEKDLNSINSLEQNVPNPFTESTQIKYFLSKNVNVANLYIYNMNGIQLKSVPLHQNGDGSVTINGGEFQAGMYMYTLIADGLVVDTKQMILTD